ncbi:MAG: protein kinase [Eubacterium sp.]|nr:protein kinase [Eubacterium sp.]
MNRIALKSGDTISLKNTDTGEVMLLEITADPLGRGSSCIVYEAKTSSKLSCKYRLKELYPSYIKGFSRDSSNQLIIDDSIADEYEKAVTRFNKSAELLWDFAYSNETGSYTVTPIGKFEADISCKHKALYIITQWMPADYIDTVSLCNSGDLNSVVKICSKTAKAAAAFHNSGYINLDIKPENILYSPKTDTISFFDTDTIFYKSEPPAHSVYYSDGAAPEIQNGFVQLYSEKSDVFSIGSMFHRFITGKNYFPGQYTLKAAAKHNELENYEMCRHNNPRIAAMIRKILSSCNAGSPSKRCNIAELISMLDLLSDLTDPESIFALNSYIPKIDEPEVYSDEVYILHRMLENERYAVIQGLHNSGKSNFVRFYANERRHCYHTIIWADYKNDIKDTIAGISFNGINDDEFTKEKLFDIKYNYLKKYDRETLLIIDGINSEDDFIIEFLETLNINIIITSASNVSFEKRHIYKMKIEQELIFSENEIRQFSNRMNGMKKRDFIFLRLYSILFLLTIVVLAVFAFVIRDYSIYFSIPMAVCMIVMLILKAMILRKSENLAVSKIRGQNCRSRFKDAFDFGNAINNQQTFEISIPDFIASSEKKRHSFRIVLGISAIIAGLISFALSIILNSFPILVALSAIIIIIVFFADYRYGIKAASDMYNDKFGSADINRSRNINEIYSFKSKSDTSEQNRISTECIRQILYSEYKIRCDNWGTVDVETKFLTVISMIALLLNSLNIQKYSYFHISNNIPENIMNYICIALLCAFSSCMVIKSKEFYTQIKDMLFAVYTGDSKFINYKFEEYCEDGIISRLAKARGIYNFAVIQFEQDIPIYEIEKNERPTFEHYCVTQNARTLVYFSLTSVSLICFFVWHLGIIAALLPIIMGSTVLQILWYVWGRYVYNRRVLKTSRN